MMRDSLLGAVAGLAATAPMTAAMKLGHRCLPWHDKYALPPRQITMRVAGTAGIRQHLSRKQKSGLTLLAHYGYGAAAGALFGAIAGAGRPRKRRSNVGQGTVFGLGVWTASYLGLLPALGILKPATRHPARRNLLMISAHVVWGVSLAGMFRTLQTTSPDENGHVQ